MTQIDGSRPLPPYARAVAAPAGSAIIFTEAMTHATLPWTGSGSRKTIFYKYCPMNLAWTALPFDAESDYPGLTERARDIMLAPPGGTRGAMLAKETLAKRVQAPKL